MQYFYPYSPTDPTKSDPDGWVICDGQTRTVTDSRYAVIAPLLNTVLGVATNTANSIKPPNLIGKFLYGSSNPTIVNEIGGNTTATLISNNMPQHTHTVNETAHSHTITDNGHTHGATQTAHSHGVTSSLYDFGYNTTGTLIPSGNVRAGTAAGNVLSNGSLYGAGRPLNPPMPTGVNINNASPEISVASASTGISLGSASTGITVNNAGQASPSAFPIMPPYVTINYIMKY
jgi:microcystin-dependent protein